MRIIGIDPGPTPGLCELRFDVYGALTYAAHYQCSANAAPTLLASLITGPVEVHIQIERFVVGRRATRSTNADAGALTRDLIGQLQQVAADHPISGTLALRTAAEVKAWATVPRMSAAMLWVPTTGMPHARDAARHALFCATRNGAPDPLSKTWRIG